MKQEEQLNMFAEVQQELKDELNVDLSIKEISNVFLSQFKIMAYGFIKGIATTIPFFGKFIPYERDFYKDNFIIPNRKEQARLIKEDKLDDAIKIYKESLDAVQAHKRKSTQIASLSAEQVLAYNNHIDIPEELDILKNIE